MNSIFFWVGLSLSSLGCCSARILFSSVTSGVIPHLEQEWIPVGCIPPACCPYLPACTAPGEGVYLPRGVYLPGGCTCPGGRGVDTCPGGCTCLGDVPAWGCTCQGGVPAQGCYLPRGCTCQGGVPVPGGTCPGTPPCEQNDRQVQKYYLAPNFICRQ